MTRSQIISIVNTRTENALVGVVDFNDLFNDVEQELCAEFRFWWLHKRLTFPTVSNTPIYDLSTITTTPTGAGPYVDEITRVVLVDAQGNVCELEPVFDDTSVTEMVAATTSNNKPSNWTIESNDLTLFQTLRLFPVPDGVYTIYVYFWAKPNPAADSSDDNIYVVPATQHHMLKTGLEKEVWRLKFGEQDPKYTTALAQYNKKVAQAKIRPSFSTQKDRLFINTDCEAIRSTR